MGGWNEKSWKKQAKIVGKAKCNVFIRYPHDVSRKDLEHSAQDLSSFLQRETGMPYSIARAHVFRVHDNPSENGFDIVLDGYLLSRYTHDTICIEMEQGNLRQDLFEKYSASF